MDVANGGFEPFLVKHGSAMPGHLNSQMKLETFVPGTSRPASQLISETKVARSIRKLGTFMKAQ